MATLPQLTNPAQANAPALVNANFIALEHQAVYAASMATAGLTFGYLGGRWGGFAITAATAALTASSTNYVVVEIATGVLTIATSSTHWNDANYARVYKITTDSVGITAVEDHRAGPRGVHYGGGGGGGGGGGKYLPIACSDESTALTTGLKITFRMPFAIASLLEVRGSLNGAPAGSTFEFDLKEGGTSVFSTKPTIDAGEKTTTTAATPAVISDTSLADDAEMTVYVTQIGSSTPGNGFKIALIGA